MSRASCRAVAKTATAPPLWRAIRRKAAPGPAERLVRLRAPAFECGVRGASTGRVRRSPSAARATPYDRVAEGAAGLLEINIEPGCRIVDGLLRRSHRHHAGHGHDGRSAAQRVGEVAIGHIRGPTTVAIVGAAPATRRVERHHEDSLERLAHA